MKQLIHFIMMGGTIDALWDGNIDSMVIAGNSQIPSFFERFGLFDETMFSQISMKDSREIKNDDLEKLAQTIEESKAIRIVITHGLYTMPDTAAFLQENLKRKDASVVLTGSNTPLKSFDISDAGLNLGYAIAKVKDLQPGIYVCLRGNVFTIPEIQKYIEDGKFYEVFSVK